MMTTTITTKTRAMAEVGPSGVTLWDLARIVGRDETKVAVSCPWVVVRRLGSWVVATDGRAIVWVEGDAILARAVEEERRAFAERMPFAFPPETGALYESAVRWINVDMAPWPELPPEPAGCGRCLGLGYLQWCKVCNGDDEGCEHCAGSGMERVDSAVVADALPWDLPPGIECCDECIRGEAGELVRVPWGGVPFSADYLRRVLPLVQGGAALLLPSLEYYGTPTVGCPRLFVRRRCEGGAVVTVQLMSCKAE